MGERFIIKTRNTVARIPPLLYFLKFHPMAKMFFFRFSKIEFCLNLVTGQLIVVISLLFQLKEILKNASVKLISQVHSGQLSANSLLCKSKVTNDSLLEIGSGNKLTRFTLSCQPQCSCRHPLFSLCHTISIIEGGYCYINPAQHYQLTAPPPHTSTMSRFEARFAISDI